MSGLTEFIARHDFPCWCSATGGQAVCHQLFGRRPFAVMACPACGTHRILPRALPTQAAAENLYNEYQSPGVLAAEEEAFVHKMFERFSAVGLRFETNSRVLDVGCGNGCLLDAICRKFGSAGKGIDVDRRRIDTALARSSRAQFECGLFEPTKADGLYDVIIASAVLEHV